MNSIRSYQRMLNLLAGVAGLGFAAAAGSLLFGQFSLPIFLGASSLLLVLVMAHDYGPRTRSALGAASGGSLSGARREERMPLAA